MRVKVAMAPGDGIGPEVMASVQTVFAAIGVPVDLVEVEMGEAVWDRGISSGISEQAKTVIEECGVLLKGPMTTPSGRGMKSVNVTARKTWSTFANKRVFRTLPGVPRRAGTSRISLTMVRENIEDTYGGIEHMQTHDVAQCRRLITRPGSEQVVRYAFEMARRKGATRITCGHKANIMKLTDGLFLQVFRDVASEYPDLRADDRIVDALAMDLVMNPEMYDVILLPNLQGDILSDLCAGLVGGLAYAPSANIGERIAIFEAVHGTAPDIAGRGVANPTALLLAACMMLRHVGCTPWADQIETAAEVALRASYFPVDPDFPGRPPAQFSTEKFTARILAVLAAMEPLDASLQEPFEKPAPALEQRMMVSPRPEEQKTVGADLFIDSDLPPSEVAARIGAVCPDGLRVTMISNRGTQVWPTGSMFTECINHHRVRVESNGDVDPAQIFALCGRLTGSLRVCSLEMLLQIDGMRAYSLAQGQ